MKRHTQVVIWILVSIFFVINTIYDIATFQSSSTRLSGTLASVIACGYAIYKVYSLFLKQPKLGKKS